MLAAGCRAKAVLLGVVMLVGAACTGDLAPLPDQPSPPPAPGMPDPGTPPNPGIPPGPGTPGQATSDTASVTIDFGIRNQTVAGFGGTTLPLVYGETDYLGGLRTAAIDTVFGKVGISLGLLNIGTVEAPAQSTDPYGQQGNDNSDPFSMNPAGFNFTGSSNLRNAIVLPAAQHGVTAVHVGALVSLRTSLRWMGNVRASDYNLYLDEVSENVLALLGYWRTNYGIIPDLVHLFNEPTSGNVELASYSVQEVVDIVKRVGARLRMAGFTNVKFVVPNEETTQRSLVVAQAILADPVARGYVGAIGFHQYPYGSVYSSPSNILRTSGQGTPDAAARQLMESLRALGNQYGIQLWMTEVSEGPGTTNYEFGSMDNVLARAIHIHDVFRYAGGSAYFGMITIWDSRSHEEHFRGRNIPFLSEQSGVALVDLMAGTVRITGMGYAIGHYARWIRPGDVVLGSTSNRSKVLASAFRSQDGTRAVLVAVNAYDEARVLRVRVDGATINGIPAAEASNGSTRWQPVTGRVLGGTVDIFAPARSVVSLSIPVR